MLFRFERIIQAVMKINLADVTLEVTEEHGDLSVDAMWRGDSIGYAYCGLGVSEIEISNIVVKSNVPVPDTFIKKVCSACGIAFTGADMRGNGVGSLLLNRVIEEAKGRGVREIWGSIVQKDLDVSPFLLAWYARHGFVITEPDERCIKGSVKKVQLEVNPI